MLRAVVRRVVIVAVLCCGSITLAGSTWTAPGWSAGQGGNLGPVATDNVDVGETVANLVSAKAGRSSPRMAAGLTGDWAVAERAPQPVTLAAADPLPKPVAIASDVYALDDDTLATHAIAVPLPPAMIAGLPALALAWLVGRRIVRG